MERTQGEQIRQKAIENALAKVKISVEYALKKIKELMEAQENKLHYDTVLREWKISPPLAALHIQLKATDMAFKLLGAYSSKKHEIVYSFAPDLASRLRRAHKGR